MLLLCARALPGPPSSAGDRRSRGPCVSERVPQVVPRVVEELPRTVSSRFSAIGGFSAIAPLSPRPHRQQPGYPDKEALKTALTELSSYPPLIFAGECRTLQSRLAKAATGEAFIVQAGRRRVHGE